MEDKEKIQWLGVILATIGAIVGIGFHIWFFLMQYKPLIAAEIAQYPTRTNWKIITYMLPIYMAFGIFAGVLHAIGLFGFLKKAKNSYNISMIANVFALQFSFWPIIPALDTGLTPIYAFIFLPNAIIYLLLNLIVGKKNFGRVVFCLITGMALVMSFINGTASMNIFWMKGEMFYAIANPVHWTAAIGFGVITVGIMVSPKKWIRRLALGITILEMSMGIPMGIMTTIEKGEFSMYLGAPALSIVILIVVIVPILWEKIVKPDLQRGN